LHEEQIHTYTFPNLVLNKDGTIAVYSRSGIDQVDSFFWNLDEPVWSKNDTVTLVDTAGNVRASFDIE